MRCHQAYTFFDLKHDSRIETHHGKTEPALRKKEKFDTVMERIVMSPEQSDTPEKPEVFQYPCETNSQDDRNLPATENLEEPIETAKEGSHEPLGFMIRNNPHTADTRPEDAVSDKPNIASQKAKMLTIEDQNEPASVINTDKQTNGEQSVKNLTPSDTLVDTKESLKNQDAIQQDSGFVNNSLGRLTVRQAHEYIQPSNEPAGKQSVENRLPADTLVDTKESVKIQGAIQQTSNFVSNSPARPAAMPADTSADNKNAVDVDNHVSRDARERVSSLAEEIEASVRTAQASTAQRVTGQDIGLSRKGGLDAVQAMAQAMEPRQNAAELTNQVVGMSRADRIVETSSSVASELNGDGSMKDQADRESSRFTMDSRSGKFVMPAQLAGNPALTGGNTAESIQMRESVGTDSVSTPFEQMLNRTERLQEVIERFDEHVLALTSSKGNSMTINLIPPNLGKIVLNCRESGGEMFIEIVAQNRQVRGFLSEHEEFIRGIVEDRGHKLAEFDVTTQDDNQRHSQFEREVTDGAQRTGKIITQVTPNQASAHNNVGEYAAEYHDGLWLVA